MNENDYVNLNNKNFESFKRIVIELKNNGSLHDIDKHGRNILFWMEDLDKVKYLVEEMQVNYNLFSDNKCTPVFFRNPEVTEFYFKKGLDINSKSNDCFSVLSVASKETTDKLVNLGVNINDKYVFLCWDRSGKDKEDFYWKINFLYSKGMNIKDIRYISYCKDPILLDIMHKNGFKIPEQDFFNALQSMINYNDTASLNFIYEHYIKGKEKEIFDEMVQSKKIEINIKMFLFFYQTGLIDSSGYKINDTPWFFTATLNEELLKFFHKDEPENFYKKDNLNNNILFYKNKGKFYDNDLKELISLIYIVPELVFEKNNQDLNFFETMDSEDQVSFISYTLDEVSSAEEKREYECNPCVKDEKHIFENVLENIIFKYMETNGSDFLEEYDYKDEVFERYAIYQKEQIRKTVEDNFSYSKAKRL